MRVDLHLLLVAERLDLSWRVLSIFLPIRSWTSKYLATHRSIHTDSPFCSSASLYFGGIHFLWQAVDNREYMSVIISISSSWTSFILSSSKPGNCAMIYSFVASARAFSSSSLRFRI